MKDYSSGYEFLYRRILYPGYETWLRRRGTLRYLAQYRRQQWASADELLDIQFGKLKSLTRHCYEQVPYYREQWDRAGIHWRDIRSIADYQRLPLLTKDDIRANYDRLIARNFHGRTWTKKTGGSTGQPLSFEYTQESNERRTAVMLRGYEWAGALPGRRTAFLWGTDIVPPSGHKRFKVRLHNAIQRRLTLNSFALSNSNVEDYLDRISRFRPEILVAYVGPIHQVARHCLDRGIAPWRPKSIITGAERLLPFQRDEIQRAFGCPVFNTYGCREFMLIASECPLHSGLHANVDHLVVELVDTSGRVSDSGAVVLTDLHNYGMPFIRYQNGDLASWQSGECDCGRHLPRLHSVEGRMVDVIRTLDGRTLPGVFFPHLMKDVRGVVRFQVVQKRLDEIIVSIVKDATFDESSMRLLTDSIRGALGQHSQVRFEFPESIPLTASGKQRVTVSLLDANA